jgi:hypothetical protein
MSGGKNSNSQQIPVNGMLGRNKKGCLGLRNSPYILRKIF